MDTQINMTQAVQASFQQLVPNANAFAARFYETLFELDPSLRALFKHDMAEQGRKLIQILVIVVNGLDRLDDLAGAVESLGKRHLAYGVADEHYATVGAALIATLEEFLGSDFTPLVRDAWLTTYQQLAKLAIRGAHAEPQTPSSSVSAN